MVADRIRGLFQEKRLVLLCLVAGAVARLAWAHNGQIIKPLLTESHNVAVSLARSGRFSDPFAVGGVATAHVGMLTPLPAAVSYWLFGVDTPIAEHALAVWSVVLLSLGFWLSWRLFCALQAPVFARVAAIGFVSLVPLQFGLEMREGRSWEVNLAVVLLMWILLRLVRADYRREIVTRSLAITGAISGFLFIVSPPAGFAAAAAIGLFQTMHTRPRRWWIVPASFALVVGLFGGIWAARNMVQLGEPILLRDNLGLELNLSNYSGAVHPADPHAAYLARMREIHPLGFGRAIEKLRAAGGEIQYYKQMWQEAGNWIAAHPVDFIYLSARHFMQFFLPPSWFWGLFGGAGKLIWLRQSLAWGTAIAGLLTLALMSYRHRAYAYLLFAALACSAPYILVQPTLRYRYLVSSLLIFAAFDGASRLTAHFLRRLAKNGNINVLPSAAWQRESHTI